MDDKTAAQFVALSIIVKALVHSHPNHEILRSAIQETMKSGFENVAEETQHLIDESVLNWINGLRKRVKNGK
jgi:hypothetical protein